MKLRVVYLNKPDRSDPDNGRKVYRKVPEPVQTRSHLSAPMLRPDGMSDTWNPVDGKRYDSKSQYERAVKAHGCEIVGNDKGYFNQKRPEYKAEGLKQDIVNAMKQQGAL